MAGVALGATARRAADCSPSDSFPHHPAEGEAGPPHLLLRGRQPPRHLGLQARAGQAARPADAGRRRSSSPSRARTATWRRAPGRSGRGASRARWSRTCCRTWPSCADEMCFIHSLTSKTNTHGPGEMFMSTGLHARGLPQHRLLGHATRWARENQRPAGLRRHPRPARRPAARPGQLGQRLPAGRLPGDGVQRRPADPAPRRGPPEISRRRRPRDARLPQAPQRRAPEAPPRRRRAGGPDRLLRAGRADAAQRPGGRRPVAREPRDAGPLRPRRPQPAHGRLRPQLPAGPAAARARGPVRHALQRRLRDGRGGPQLGRPPADQVRLRPPRPDPRPARRRRCCAT